MSVPTVPDVIARPGDGEVDMFGLTHPGKVRGENQDHFLVCSLRRQVRVHLTSLPNPERLDGEKQRVAFLAMVADGVGGSGKGGEASRLAVEAVTKYVTNSLYTCYAVDPADAETFSAALYDAAMQCHEEIEQLAMENRELMGMATTLTVWLGVWPKGYLLQVGDSRCYLMRDGDLMQLSRDQTMAQELIDAGVMSRTDAHGTRLEHVLSSSIGGPQTAPVVTAMDWGPGSIGLMCSDGLTKHVSDDQIRARLASMTSAKQVCEDLLQDALDGGGTDNITVVVGKVRERADGRTDG